MTVPQQFEVSKQIYQFNTYIEKINLSFNQYLLLGQEPILVHTGSYQQTVEILPLLKQALNGQSLDYVFISHFESDECGGLSLIVDNYPHVKVICSQITARQLLGFDLAYEFQGVNPKDILQMGEYEFEFIRYPAEMHLWEGLLAFERRQGILFSSDLFMRPGTVVSPVTNANWLEEVDKITLQQVPSPEAKEELQKVLRELPVKAIALGHGPFLKIE
jgi:flavorubredoxin